MSWMGLGLWGTDEDALGLGRRVGVVVTGISGMCDAGWLRLRHRRLG